MLDRHAIQELLRADVVAHEVAKRFKTSVRTVRRIARESAVETSDDRASRAVREIGRPGVSAAVEARVRAWLEEEPALPPGEVWRLLREEGTPLGLSTVYRVLKSVRARSPRRSPASKVTVRTARVDVRRPRRGGDGLERGLVVS